MGILPLLTEVPMFEIEDLMKITVMRMNNTHIALKYYPFLPVSNSPVPVHPICY